MHPQVHPGTNFYTVVTCVAWLACQFVMFCTFAVEKDYTQRKYLQEKFSTGFVGSMRSNELECPVKKIYSGNRW